MKKIYTLLSVLFVCSQANAQLTLTQAANEPVIGDVWVNIGYDSTSAVPKTTGTGVVWNFNSLAANSNSGTVTYTNVASAPSPSVYPLANIAGMKSPTKAEYFKSSTNKLEMLGFIDNSQVVFNPPVTWFNWPISYGSSQSGTLAALETVGTNTANWAGNANFQATGTGTVILPGGKTYNNCLQYRRVVDINITGSYTSQYHIVNYEYYAAGRKLPIMKVEYFAATTGTNVSKDFNLNIDAIALTVGVNELTDNENEMSVYPVPSSSILFFNLPNQQNAEQVYLTDLTGKIVYSSANINAIDVSVFSQGLYILKVVTKETVYQKSVIVGN